MVADKSGREYGEDWDYRDMKDLLRAGKSHSAGTVHWFGMKRRGQDLPLPKHPWLSVGTGITFLGKNLRMGNSLEQGWVRDLERDTKPGE